MQSRQLLVVIAALSLTGCGTPLGDYRFENARMVTGDTLDRVDPQGTESFQHDLIRVELSSDTDVEALHPGDLHILGDFCPFHQRLELGIFGPFYGDRRQYIGTAQEAAEEGVAAIGNNERIDDNTVSYAPYYPNRHPRKDPRTGRYVYTIYINPYVPPNVPFGRGPADHPYDLRTDHRDLCLEIDNPGYAFTGSRSKRFTIPGAAIAAALAKGTSH